MDDSLLPVTSLHHKLNQADLAFLIFVQRNKINPALCKMPITDPQHTIWTGDSFPQQTSICDMRNCANKISHYVPARHRKEDLICYGIRICTASFPATATHRRKT